MVMVATVGVLWLHSLLSLSSAERAIRIRTTAKFVKQCVELHNRYRAAVLPDAANMHFMSWDAGLAKTAKAWSKTCKFKDNPFVKIPEKVHPYFQSIGENLYITPGKFTVEQAIEEWNADGKHFDFYQNTCAKQKKCDRFTQLIWGDSYKLGCGANHCRKGIQNSNLTNGIVFVCNYSPSGNLKGELPFIKGPPCTYCGPDFCRHKLCSDPDRETIIQYPEWKPDFGSASILLSKCFLLLLFIIIHILW